jgi:hypothetical protein
MTIPAADYPYLAAVADIAAATAPTPPPSQQARRRRALRSFVGRHPVASLLVATDAISWLSWTPVLFLGAPPRLFSAIGAVLGLALPVFLVTAATDGLAGVRNLMLRVLRWRTGGCGDLVGQATGREAGSPSPSFGGCGAHRSRSAAAPRTRSASRAADGPARIVSIR